MSDSAEIEGAVAECVRAGGSDPAVRQLRELIEWLLIDRLTIISDDRELLLRSLDEAFARFGVAVRSRAPLNWIHWILATALALAAENAKHVTWVDWVGGSGPDGTPEDKRMLVFRVILLLDSWCQWRLLTCVRQPANTLLAVSCYRELRRRLQTIANS